MNNIVIQAVNLTKVYRLYKKPYHRFLDMFGLLRTNNGAYSEYSALAGIDLSIGRGEKVAIIGRNGAGKSTFLKIVSKIIEPTSGHLIVNGKVHALLTIGAGFHPDFTGRENAYSYLEHMGISGAAADDKVEEIIQFAEIEEYIDQPIKTYSTGMGARLMFSTSTAIAPDILIIDEVLGVGDAYFTKKCYDRMKQLCEGDGTTLLLVTHDVYAASAFCDRMIWIDRGYIVQDDKSDTVVKAYEASIRLQEEERLRQKTLLVTKKNHRINQPKDMLIYFQIVTENRVPIEKNLPVYSIKIFNGEKLVDEISMESGSSLVPSEHTGLILKDGESNWGQPYEKDGKWARDFQPFGSIFQRAPFVFRFGENFTAGSNNIAVEIELLDTIKQSCYLELYSSNGQALCQRIDVKGDQERRIHQVSFELDNSDKDLKSKPKVFGLKSLENIASSGKKFGSRRLAIKSIKIEDGKGEEKLIFNPRENIDIVISFIVLDPKFSDNPTVMASIHKEGAKISTRIISQEFFVEKNTNGVGDYTVKAKLRPCLLGPGTYSVGVGLYEHNYFEKSYGRHFAENPMVLDKQIDVVHFEIKNRGDDWNFYLLEYIQPVEWAIEKPQLP